MQNPRSQYARQGYECGILPKRQHHYAQGYRLYKSHSHTMHYGKLTCRQVLRRLMLMERASTRSPATQATTARVL